MVKLMRFFFRIVCRATVCCGFLCSSAPPAAPWLDVASVSVLLESVLSCWPPLGLIRLGTSSLCSFLSGRLQVLSSGNFCSAIKVNPEFVLFITWRSAPPPKPFSCWCGVFSSSLSPLDLLTLWESWGGLRTLFTEQEYSSPLFGFSPFSIIDRRTSRTLDEGLRQMGDIGPSFSKSPASALDLHPSWLRFLEEKDDSSLIWLWGVSGTERTRSGEEGGRFSRSWRKFFFKGESCLITAAFPSLLPGWAAVEPRGTVVDFLHNGTS